MLIIRFIFTKSTNIFSSKEKLCKLVVKSCSTDTAPSIENKDRRHPYKQLHPWKSKQNFYEHLLETVTYNKEGLVALNKPYGIQMKQDTQNQSNQRNYIPHSVNYTLSESLPFLAERLGYSKLIIAQGPEKYSSGVTLLAENEKIQNYVKKSEAIALTTKSFPFVYWIITTKLPRENCGTKTVGITLTEMNNEKRPLIVHSWTKASLKNKTVKLVHTNFQLLSNSTGNYASLIELKLTARKWNFIRLFAATELYSPILGDNYYGARVQNLMGAWVLVSPFSPTAHRMPVLQSDLIDLLELRKSQQEIIPPHMHLKQVILPGFGPKKTVVKIEASLPAFFEWTCEKLQFKTEKMLCPSILNVDDYKNNNAIFAT